MNCQVDIDEASGFCAGVIKAISTAEKYLSENGPLYSLGAIVHNDEELSRLADLGLRSVDTLSSLPAEVKTVLIRAHGEPPATYQEAQHRRLQVIDCTCPVVIRLQKLIRERFLYLQAHEGCLIIFGKKGHAEVLGLQGQTDGSALIVENLEQLQAELEAGRINVDKAVEIFSQTTKNPVEYRSVCDYLSAQMKKGSLKVHDTICRQVSSRHKSLSDFAISHDIIIFASGKSSSNGKVLYDLCKKHNVRSFAIEAASQLEKEWFREGDKVGVCGATSTPKWLLEQIKDAILTM